MTRSVTSWPAPRVQDPDAAWIARKARFRRTLPNRCQLCDRGDWRLWFHTFKVHLQVHHRHGRVKPLGTERDDELMLLCRPCHRAITTAHNRLAKARGCMDRRGRIVDLEGYSRCVTKASDNARPRYLSIIIRRLLFDSTPKEQV